MFSESLNQTLYLASGSPRRKQILGGVGWKFDVLSAPVNEDMQPGETPRVYTLRLALSKTQAVISRLAASIENQKKENGGILPARYHQSQIFILGADTTVVDGKDMLGKPRDEAEAVQMLTRLRSRIHQVYTGIALARYQPSYAFGTEGKDLDADISVTTAICTTDVVMRDYSDEEITEYVASGDPMDKAGAYAIQNQVFKPVRSIRGCYANVVGLPLCHTAQAFKDIGVQPPLSDAGIFPRCEKMFADDLLCLECCQAVWLSGDLTLSSDLLPNEPLPKTSLHASAL